MNSWSLRIKRNQALIEWLKKNSKEKKQLTPLEERYFKPVNVPLKQFHPREKSLRIRFFLKERKAQLAFLTFFYKRRAYSHNRYIFFEGSLKEAENIVLNLGFEEWGKQKIQRLAYSVNYKNKKLSILDESLNGENCYLKIEASGEKTIIEFLKKFQLSEKETLRKNMIWLLALKKKLIS